MDYTDYLGIPYEHLGRDRKGLDCYGLLILYYQEILNFKLKDWWYEADWCKKGHNYFLDNADTVSQKVSVPKKHDIVLFQLGKTGVVNHAGIVVDAPYGVLQVIKTGVMMTSLQSPVLRNHIEGFYRICQS